MFHIQYVALLRVIMTYKCNNCNFDVNEITATFLSFLLELYTSFTMLVHTMMRIKHMQTRLRLHCIHCMHISEVTVLPQNKRKLLYN